MNKEENENSYCILLPQWTIITHDIIADILNTGNIYWKLILSPKISLMD